MLRGGVCAAGHRSVSGFAAGCVEFVFIILQSATRRVHFIFLEIGKFNFFCSVQVKVFPVLEIVGFENSRFHDTVWSDLVSSLQISGCQERSRTLILLAPA